MECAPPCMLVCITTPHTAHAMRLDSLRGPDSSKSRCCHCPAGRAARAQVLKRIEADAGRDVLAGQRWGPRPLDMDIIFYGAGGALHGDKLTVPHPRLVGSCMDPCMDGCSQGAWAYTTGSGLHVNV